jgi:hypothetical protein
MSVLVDLIAGYASPIQKVGEDLSEIVRIQSHVYTSYCLSVATWSERSPGVIMSRLITRSVTHRGAICLPFNAWTRVRQCLK